MPNYRRLNLYKSFYDVENRQETRRFKYYFSKLMKEAERRKIQKAIIKEFGKEMPYLEEKVRQRLYNSCMKYINSCKIA
jgi:hypothetical protein